jgi:hypothetical protein
MHSRIVKNKILSNIKMHGTTVKNKKSFDNIKMHSTIVKNKIFDNIKMHGTTVKNKKKTFVISRSTVRL